MKLVGITGGIGAGKSTVARLFQELGAAVIDADVIAKEIIEPGADAWHDLLKEFGGQILNPDSSINRSRLASLIFGEPAARLRLNEITHPRIKQVMLKKAQEYFAQGASVVMVEAALIGESSHDPPFDAIVLVWIDPAVQMERIMRQGKMKEEEASRRIASQMPSEKKKEIATYIIDNSGDLEETKRQVKAIWEDIAS